MAFGYVVEGPQPAAPTKSLIRAAQVVDGPGKWEGGFSWQPRGCTTGNQGLRICTSQTITFANARDHVNGIPFELATAEICSAFGWEAIDYKERVRELYEVFEAKAIEHEFWTGAIEPSGQHLAAGGSVTNLTPGGGPISPVNAMACLEGYIASCGTGGRGMIHMSRAMIPQLASVGMLIEKNDTLFTHTGTIVVPGAGYPGTGPAGTTTAGTEWIFATGWVKILRGEITPLPDRIDEAMNRSTNEIAWAATRTVGLMFDPCCLAAINVTSVTCGP